MVKARSGVLIFTSGKGGVGKTPLALLMSLILSRIGKQVVALDFNFNNPDLYEIFSRLEVKNRDIISEVGGETLKPPLTIFEVESGEGGRVFAATRIERYRYLPYPPSQIFRSILAVKEWLENDAFFVIDTNLNIASFALTDVEHSKVIKKVEEDFDQVNMVYFLTPSVISFSTTGRGKGSIDLLKETLNSFNRYNINILGNNGEKIIYMVTPTVYDVESFYDGFLSSLSTIIKKAFGMRGTVNVIEPLYKNKDRIRDIMNDLMAPYIRSTRSMNLNELESLIMKMQDEFKKRGFTSTRFIKSADATDIQTIFFNTLLEFALDQTTRTLPRNLIFIPFVLKSMINFVDIMLMADELDIGLIIEKQKEIYDFMVKWINEVYFRGI
ncbi:MAG: hypothetical protein ACP6IP_05630 [Candidatus Njordarchaeia archaeon]